MPLFDGTVAAAGLSKPPNMSGPLGQPTLQYGGAYFTYDTRAKEGVEFTSPWTTRSPVSHYPGVEGPSHHIIYRQDSNSSDEGQPHSSSMHPVVVKQGFTLYAKSPGMSSPTSAASVAIRKQKLGGENCSPKPDSSVYFAIPKPVYGHNACCHELGCVMGPHYAMEHGPQRIPTAVYEHSWMPADAHYGERPLVQRKQDPLLQQRGLQFEPSPEQIKRMNMEAYGSSRAGPGPGPLPPVMDANYSSYPCSPAGAQFASLSEQNKRLQTSPRDYASLYSAPPTYEHMTSEAHQERLPVSKYGHLTQHPMFYYPQASVEIESRTQCKDIGRKQREDIPVVVKHAGSNPRDNYIVPQSLHGEIPETLPNHSFTQNFEYPCYAVPRVHLSASQITPPLKRHHTLPGLECMNISVSNQHMHHPLDSVASLPKNKPSGGLRVDHSHPSPSFLSVERTSPTQSVSQSGVLHSNVKMNRFFPTLPPAGVNMNRTLDYGPCEVQVACHRPPKELPGSPVAWLPRSPDRSQSIHAAAANSMNVRTIVYSPVVAAGNKLVCPQAISAHTALKGSLKRSVSHVSSLTRGQEDGDLDGMDLSKKRPKTVIENAKARSNAGSPPMPVIGNVFSLAPYQAYLQTSAVLVPGRGPPRPTQSYEHHVVRPTPCLAEKRPDRDAVCRDAPAERPFVQVIKPKSIKAEKVPQADEDAIVSRHKTSIKKEQDVSGLSDSRTVLDITKWEPAELENGPTDEKSSDEPKAAEFAAQEAPHSDSQSPDNKHSFRNIPPRCLKLSSYKIILPHTKHLSGVVSLEKQLVPTVSEFPPKQLQVPVRQHFFELHRSLCKLVFRSVSASSEQKLRTWLSKLELSEPLSTSDKVQKVSCLLGKKLREEWLNEEIKPALQNVLGRLREYTIQERCPFPHVMRTGAVFLPMLVVKELLFPMVQSSYIDQVLQEHRVELRPTTLSEEKILIQLHKRACSSRLRRLMSLKHLPDIYTDVLNLLYYAYVCKHLEVGVATSVKTARVKEDSTSCRSRASSEVADSPASPSDGERNPRDDKAKGRTKNSSQHIFLDDSWSDTDKADDTGKAQRGSTENRLGDEGANRGCDAFDGEPDSSVATASENSWTRPLTLEDLSLFESDTENTKESGITVSKSQLGSRTSSGVVLKLRKMCSKGLSRKKARYQTITDSGTGATSISHTEASANQEAELHQRTSRVGPRWRRTTSFPGSRRKHKSLLKIKYCPYLSACHSAEHRRRWVLRSAVQRARRVMRFYYPDLVGKTIHHLYEEVDKSEVWYRGEVVSIHEAHSNPLKTIFEVRYDSEPEWKYYLELLMDYKKGWLKIEDS